MIEVAIVALKSALPDEFPEEEVFAGIREFPETDGETQPEPDEKPEETVCRAGDGVAVSFMDNSSIYQRKMVQKLLSTARKYGIPCQIKRGVTARNDAANYQRTGNGALVCTLSVPCRYIHSGASVCSLQDVDAQYSLTKAYLMNV